MTLGKQQQEKKNNDVFPTSWKSWKGGINSTNLIRTLYGCTSNHLYTDRYAESPIGVAVVSAIMKSPDPYQSTQTLKDMIQEFKGWLRAPEEPFSNPQVKIQLKLAVAMMKFHSKTSTPLIHHITNTVVQNDCANLTLAYGCSPIMSSNLNEMEDLVNLKTGSLVLNLGTFDDNQVQAMKSAGRQANLTGKPVIFDPVGVGASRERKKRANGTFFQWLSHPLSFDYVRLSCVWVMSIL
jgi:thiamine-phosphate diphosphorylase/hydroxyethylthiazole kinase